MKVLMGFALCAAIACYRRRLRRRIRGKRPGTGQEIAQALQVVERILKGDRMNELDLKNLDEAVIRPSLVGPKGR
jgi:hypothetical protein